MRLRRQRLVEEPRVEGHRIDQCLSGEHIVKGMTENDVRMFLEEGANEDVDPEGPEGEEVRNLIAII